MARSGMISIFCNKSVKFRHPKDRDVFAVVRDHDFVTAPSWIVDTSLFKMLEKEGSIKLIKSSSDAKGIETKGKVSKEELDKFDDVVIPEPMSGGKEELPDPEEVEEVEEVNESKDEEAFDPYEGMTAMDLYNKCIEEGLDVEKKKSKKYYINELNKVNEDPEEVTEDEE